MNPDYTDSNTLSTIDHLFQPVHVLPIRSILGDAEPTFGLVYKICREARTNEFAFKGLVPSEDIERLNSPEALLDKTRRSPLIIGDESIIDGFKEFCVYTYAPVPIRQLH